MYFEDEEVDQYEGEMPEDDDNMRQAPGANKDVISDIKNLKEAQANVPDSHKEKVLRACLKCKLILSESQWNKVNRCINCDDEDFQTTPYFCGSISMFMPSASWVARWNNLEGKKPGVYAVSVSEYMDDGGYNDIGNTKKNAKKRKRATEDDIYSDQDVEDFYQ